VHVPGRKTFERALRGCAAAHADFWARLVQAPHAPGPVSQNTDGARVSEARVPSVPPLDIRAGGVLGAMKAKERDMGRSSGMMTQIISATFWLYIGGIILLALFQAMPAAAYLRGKNRSASEKGDRHDA
jgi:hypothetical protein